MAPTAIISCYNYPFSNVDLLFAIVVNLPDIRVLYPVVSQASQCYRLLTSVLENTSYLFKFWLCKKE